MPLYYKAQGKDPLKSGIPSPQKVFGTTRKLSWDWQDWAERFLEVVPWLLCLAWTQYTWKVFLQAAQIQA